MSCYICNGNVKTNKITHVQEGITFHNFPVRECTSCGEQTFAIGRLVYYPIYAKHLKVNEFDCDSIDWKELCTWINLDKN